MPSLFFYIFWLLFALIGLGLVAQLLLPVGGQRCYDEMRQNRSRAWALVGFGMALIGILSLIHTYAENHTMAEGVIFIPSFIMLWVLVGSLMCIVVGALWLLSWRTHKSDTASAPAEESLLESEAETQSAHRSEEFEHH